MSYYLRSIRHNRINMVIRKCPVRDKKKKKKEKDDENQKLKDFLSAR